MQSLLKSNYKTIITNVIFTTTIGVSSFLFWRQIGELLKNQIFEFGSISLEQAIITLLIFSMFIAVFILVGLLHTKVSAQLVIYLVSVLPIFLLPLTLQTNLLFAGVLYVLLIVINGLVQHDLELHIKASLIHIFSPKLTLFTTAISIIIATQFFVATHIKIQTTTISIPSEYIDSIFNVSEPFVRKQLEHQQELLLSSYFDKLDEQIPFLKDVPTEDKLALLNGNLPDSIHSLLVEQGFTQEQIDGFSEQIRLDFATSEADGSEDNSTAESPTDFIDSIFSEARVQLEEIVSQFIESNKGTIPWFISGFVFFTFSSIGILIKFLAIFIASIILRLLITFKLVEKTEVLIKTERYIIPHLNPELSNSLQSASTPPDTHESPSLPQNQ